MWEIPPITFCIHGTKTLVLSCSISVTRKYIIWLLSGRNGVWKLARITQDVPDGRSSSTLDDQSILHDILMNYGNSDELWALLPILKNHVTNSSSSDIIQHVEHILRPDGGDWTGDSVTRRVAIGIRLVDRIKWPPSHWR